MKLIELLLCAIISCCIIKSSESLTEWNGSSVCKFNRSRHVSRYVPYIETYKKRVALVFWKRATRYNYRWESHVEWYTDEICCDGYNRDPITYNCIPVCAEGCPNGSCIAPQQCSCNTGYSLSIIAGLQTCIPDCPQGCINGYCSAPLTCSCYNKFKLSDEITCIPTCNPECGIGSHCAEPDKCVCLTGYAFKNNTASTVVECEPFCSNGCPKNSSCLAPDSCVCHPGYTKQVTTVDELSNSTSFVCEPVCDKCYNGTCIGPNQCVCDKGYIIIDDSNDTMCQPYCEGGCINGQCISPDNCTCDYGYVMDSLNSSMCVPVCQHDCGGHGDCVGPNDCLCYEGFIKDNITTGAKSQPGYWSCINPCETQCTHGSCNIENRTCECFYGWIGQNCGVPSLCGIIYRANDWDLPHWIVKVNGTTGILDVVNWDGPMCNQKCDLDNHNDTRCFILGDSNRKKDDAYVCFLDIGSICNSLELGSSSFIYSGIAGTIVLIITIVGSLGAIIVMRKRRRNDCTNPTDNLLEQSDPADSLLQTDESSYL